VRRMNLIEAGISEGISEVIVTTRSASGEPNAAPIGIITTTTNGDEHFVRLYEGSKTLYNVLETNTLAANVTEDAVLFVKAAFETLNAAWLSLFHDFPVLKEANAWVLFASSLIEKKRESLLFQLAPLAVKITAKEVKAINRGRNAVIEAAILATRSVIIKNKGEKEDRERQMEHYAAIVAKCGGRSEKAALRIIQAQNIQSKRFANPDPKQTC
jgi:hypothetical protein